MDSEGRIVELDDDPQLQDRPHGERRDRHRINDGGEGSSRRYHEHRSSGGSHRSRRSHRSSEREGHRDGERHRHNGSRHEGYVPGEVGRSDGTERHQPYSGEQRNDTTERLDGLVQDTRDMGVDDRDHDSHDRHEKRY